MFRLIGKFEIKSDGHHKRKPLVFILIFVGLPSVIVAKIIAMVFSL